jgi:hypothetical protein
MATLAACGGGGDDAPPTVGATDSNRAPTISGSPPQNIVVGQQYNFQPSANDPDGDVLSFTISGKPGWATFSTSTGSLSGTPAAQDVGSAANIRITVADGRGASASLSNFAIQISQSGSGSARLSWAAPTERSDSSPLTDLAGFNIYYGTSPSALTQTVQVGNPSVSTYMIENLSSGATWYFEVAAYSAGGAESAHSPQVSKTIT